MGVQRVIWQLVYYRYLLSPVGWHDQSIGFIAFQELKREKDRCKNLESDIEQLRNSFDTMQQHFDKLKEQCNIDKESWYNVKVAMQNEVDNIKGNEMILQLKVTEYEKSLEILREEPDEIRKAYVEHTFRYSQQILIPPSNQIKIKSRVIQIS